MCVCPCLCSLGTALRGAEQDHSTAAHFSPGTLKNIQWPTATPLFKCCCTVYPVRGQWPWQGWWDGVCACVSCFCSQCGILANLHGQFNKTVNGHPCLAVSIATKTRWPKEGWVEWSWAGISYAEAWYHGCFYASLPKNRKLPGSCSGRAECILQHTWHLVPEVALLWWGYQSNAKTCKTSTCLHAYTACPPAVCTVLLFW